MTDRPYEVAICRFDRKSDKPVSMLIFRGPLDRVSEQRAKFDGVCQTLNLLYKHPQFLVQTPQRVGEATYARYKANATVYDMNRDGYILMTKFITHALDNAPQNRPVENPQNKYPMRLFLHERADVTHPSGIALVCECKDYEDEVRMRHQLHGISRALNTLYNSTVFTVHGEGAFSDAMINEMLTRERLHDASLSRYAVDNFLKEAISSAPQHKPVETAAKANGWETVNLEETDTAEDYGTPFKDPDTGEVFLTDISGMK